LSFNNGSNNGVFIARGQLGGNYQFGSFVVGVEGDFDSAANNNNTGGGVAISECRLESKSAPTTDGCRRLPPVSASRLTVLFYGKAGGGWVGNSSFTVTNATSLV
jgi:outer membrane immunogenic protein